MLHMVANTLTFIRTDNVITSTNAIIAASRANVDLVVIPRETNDITLDQPTN